MDGLDDSYFEDSWNTSLRDDLLSDYSLGPSFNLNLSSFMDQSPLPRTFSSQPSQPYNPPPPPQHPQVHNSQVTGSSSYQAPPSTSLNQRRSHLDLPNFPLQSDPVGTPSNTSGRPLVPCNPSPRPTLPVQGPPRPRSATPLSADTFWSSPESSDSSIQSDSPFPDTEDLIDFVDLTQYSSPPSMPSAPRPQKRRNAIIAAPLSRDTSTAPSNPAKRRKIEASQSSNEPVKVEEIDLRDVDDDKGLSQVLERQRMATIKAQQEQANKPVKLSTLQCIICMENMKDLTATHCGHLFCHACLMEALIAGENQGSEPGKGTPKCPVCRKKVVRPTDRHRKDNLNVVPLAMKIKVRSNVAKGKARAL